ncbi:MAG: phosphate/phosphite/phosphonate ABC transporter substrate-binding protein [Acidimicrobiales bacterium]
MLRDHRDPLRFTTWLVPGLPLGFFETIAEAVATRLGSDFDLSVAEGSSGPMDTADDRFAQATTDIGFVCSTSYLWLSAADVRSVSLVPLAPVFDDPRAEGRPVYFSDVVVAADGPISSFADLAGKRVGFNDDSSLSGYISLLARLGDDGHRTDRFADFRAVGSHRTALALIANGEIDAAAVDANALRAWIREDPERAPLVRSVEVLGPYPVQPIVVRASDDAGLVDVVAEQLRSPALLAAVKRFGVDGFAPVDHDYYSAVNDRIALAATAIAAP